jgi:hypothetical protein
MDRTVVWTNRTPGLTRSWYECRTACAVVRPNITSSFEKPKTNPSALSISKEGLGQVCHSGQQAWAAVRPGWTARPHRIAACRGRGYSPRA